MQQGPPSDRRGKEKGDLRLAEGQRGAGMRQNPGQQKHDEKQEGRGGFGQAAMFGGQQPGDAAGSSAAETAKDVTVKIERGHNGADKIFGLAEAADTGEEAVLGGMKLVVEEGGGNHDSPLLSPVARKKPSSRLAPADCSENRSRTSCNGPSIIFRPSFKMRTCDQTSSSKCSRCELIKMAAPARARLRIESFIRRMP